MNAAEAGVNKASARQSLVEQVGQVEQRERHRRQLSRVHRRSSKSVGASRRADQQGRRQVQGRVGQDRFRRRVANENLSVSGSARRHLLAQLNTDNMTEVHRPDFISRSRLRLVEDLRMKRAANEKECRALTLSRRRPSTSASSNSSSSSSSNEASRLPQSITARDKDSRKVERRDNQKKRHRQVSNNFVVITPVAPE